MAARARRPAGAPASTLSAMAVVRKIACVVERDRRSRRARLHRRARASIAGAAVQARAVPPPGARSVRPSRLLAGVAGVLDRQLAARARPARRSPTRSRARSRRGWSASWSPARDGLGQAAVRRLRRRPAEDVVLFAAGPASRRSPRSCGRSRPTTRRASSSSTAPGRRTSSSTARSSRRRAARGPVATCRLVCEGPGSPDGRRRVAGRSTLCTTRSST